MSSPRTTPTPHVSRSYDVTPEACASAVALLLQSPADKKKAAEGHHPDGRDDTEEPKNDRTAEPEYSR